MINDKSIERFLEELASQSPTPGGGSVAAIVGAMGGALVSMVCNLTIGKPAYASVEAEMQTVLQQAEAVRRKLADLVQADVAVFDQVMAAYRLPKDSDEDKRQRSEAIQTALKAATEVPLECARLNLEVMQLSKIAAEHGNPGVVTDAGAAVAAAHAAFRSSMLNVMVNTKHIKDQAFALSRTNELKALDQQAEALNTEIFNTVLNRL